jgi:hypothetical protein
VATLGYVQSTFKLVNIHGTAIGAIDGIMEGINYFQKAVNI